MGRSKACRAQLGIEPDAQLLLSGHRVRKRRRAGFGEEPAREIHAGAVQRALHWLMLAEKRE